jgi:hypothetical protein
MALRFKRGLGQVEIGSVPGSIAAAASGPAMAVADSDWANCRGWASYFNPGCYFGGPPSNIAPPRAPTGDVLTVPPASGEEAQATIDEILNQQMRDQQALAAGQVKSSWWDSLTGGAYAAGTYSPGGVSWMVWATLAIGGFALVTLGGGSPRRYGR